jgi:hypothetical protein
VRIFTRNPHRACRAAGAVLAIAMAALAAPATGAASADPACFGAASRDPGHRCTNPALRSMVVPTPEQALLEPSAPCSPFDAPISACTFGSPAAAAGATVALVGDSHARHWRAALWPVIDALGWSGVSLDRDGCQLSRAVSIAAESRQSACAAWNLGVTQWLTDHPDVHTIFTSNRSVSSSRGRPGLLETAPGQSQRAARLEGIFAAWAALPPTVQHIIVIRDDPFVRGSTVPCVQRAIRIRIDAGRACAFPRKTALRPDYYVVAARKLGSARIQVIDLTHFFCGKRFCYPIVGGALVYRDYYDHLTTVFATTLGPYLLAKVEQLNQSP